MSESNGVHEIFIPTTKVVFRFEDGPAFSLCLTSAAAKAEEILSEGDGKRESEGEGAKRDAYLSFLAPFRSWVKTETGVELTLGQADRLWQHIREAEFTQKKEFNDRLKSLLSTESTPPDSTL